MLFARWATPLTGLLIVAILIVAGCEPPPRPEDTEAFRIAEKAIQEHGEVQRRMGKDVRVVIDDSGIDEDYAWFRLTVSGTGTMGSARAVVKKNDGKWELANLTANIGGKDLDLMEEEASP